MIKLIPFLYTSSRTGVGNTILFNGDVNASLIAILKSSDNALDGVYFPKLPSNERISSNL